MFSGRVMSSVFIVTSISSKVYGRTYMTYLGSIISHVAYTTRNREFFDVEKSSENIASVDDAVS